MQRFVLTKDQLCLLGSCSLQGILYNKGYKPGELTIVFQGSSISYCHKHNGPELLTMSDYTPFCLVESILTLQESGWKIKVELEGIS